MSGKSCFNKYVFPLILLSDKNRMGEGWEYLKHHYQRGKLTKTDCLIIIQAVISKLDNESAVSYWKRITESYLLN